MTDTQTPAPTTNPVSKTATLSAKVGSGAVILAAIAGLILHFTNPTDPSALMLGAGFTKLGLGLVGFGVSTHIQTVFDYAEKIIAAVGK